MFDSLNPKSVPLAGHVLSAMVTASKRMPDDARSIWMSRMDHVYGPLDGQRGLDIRAVLKELPPLNGAKTTEELVLALHTYFVLAADLVALNAVDESPGETLRSLASTPHRSLRQQLASVSCGRALSERGINGALHSFPFDWYVEVLTLDDLLAFRQWLRFLASREESLRNVYRVTDPMGTFYQQLMPKNLLHALGEVYTPTWLAELLVEESGWEPGETLLDPFCGSGVFLLAALRKARAIGASLEKTLQSLLGIDLNPVACATARCNLVLFMAPEGRAAWRGLSLPIISADTLAPSIALGQAMAQSPEKKAPTINVDGETVSLSSPRSRSTAEIAGRLSQYGLRLQRWLDNPDGLENEADEAGLSARDRRYWEQMAVFDLLPASYLLTNPPWIGWEYQSRSYRNYVQPGWEAYKLYSATGKGFAFLKEDISTLALVSVWDRLLMDKGVSAAVIRKASMTSELASRGLRRLKLFPDREPLRLQHVHVFDGIRVFSFAQTESAVWRIKKGEQTNFPVSGDMWSRLKRGWQPSGTSSLDEVESRTKRTRCAVAPVEASESQSRWSIGASECVRASSELATGSCPYVGRTGVFTGGANAVYYLEAIEDWHPGFVGRFRNVVGRAKRVAEQVEVDLETELIYEVVRGRDLRRWSLVGNALILCPHSAETRMDALPPSVMKAKYPGTYSYLERMKPVLDERRGFTAWEQAFRKRAFYAIQRIGAYTFSPYKVAWKYIASDFVVAVIGPDNRGKPRMPNDKVMFVAVDSAEEAYYLAGVLSSSPYRWQVVSHTSGRQISASAISPLSIPEFDDGNAFHHHISDICRLGHARLAHSPGAAINDELERIDQQVAALLGWPIKRIAAFREAMQKQRLV